MNKREVLDLLIVPQIVVLSKLCKSIGIEQTTNLEHFGTLDDPVALCLTAEIQKMTSHMLTPDEFYKQAAALYEKKRQDQEHCEKAAAALVQDAEKRRELEAEAIAISEALAREEDARLSLLETEEGKNGNGNTENTGSEFPFGSGAGGAPDDRR